MPSRCPESRYGGRSSIISGRGSFCRTGRSTASNWGQVVFSDPREREVLNRLVHPAVFAAWQGRLREIEESGRDAIVLSDIPLLIEAGFEPMVDVVLLVYVSPEEQIRRLMGRNGLTREEAEKRVASQMPIGEKVGRADIVIRNEGPLAETAPAVDRVWEELCRRRAAFRVGRR